jgi:quercetin dioxygenase-like cupin family protein
MSQHLSAGEAMLLRPEDGALVAWFGSLMTVKVTGEATGGSHSLVEVMEPPGAASAVHIHSEDETMYVLEGEHTVRSGELEAIAGPGTVVSFPRGIPHCHSVSGNGNARALLFFAPGGVEGFFVEAGPPTHRRELPSPTGPGPARLAGIAKKYGLEIVAPPPDA